MYAPVGAVGFGAALAVGAFLRFFAAPLDGADALERFGAMN